MKKLLCALAVLALVGCQSGASKPKCTYHISHDSEGIVTSWNFVKGDQSVCSATSKKLDDSVKSGKFKVPATGGPSGTTFDVTP